MTKFLYGFTETGVNAIEIFLRLHLLVYYTSVKKLPPTWVGIVLALSIFWDALIDPWIGELSDRFKSKTGTRLPMVILGAIFSAFFLVFLYQPPSSLEGSSLLFYLLGVSLALNTCYTFFAIPYTAMVGDFTENRSERAQFIAWRFVFANLGAVLGIGIPGFFLAQSIPDPYSHASWILAIVVVSAALVSTIKPPPKTKINTTTIDFNLKKSIQMALKNTPFLWLILAFFVLNIGLAINSSAALYYYRFRVLLSEQEIQNLLLLFLLVFSLSIPFWISIGKKWGRKKTLLFGALGLGVSNFIIYPLLPEKSAAHAYFWASCFGGFWVGVSVLMEAILTDTIDYDKLRTRKDNFGLYFGLWKFSGKSSRAIALLFTGALLDWVGISFPDDLTGPRLAILFGPGVGSFFILAALLIIPYGLTENKVERVKTILSRRSQRADDQSQ